MDVATMLANLEGVASGMTSTGRAHDFGTLFRDDGPGLWRALYDVTVISADAEGYAAYGTVTIEVLPSTARSGG